MGEQAAHDRRGVRPVHGGGRRAAALGPPAGDEIGDTAERITAEWLARKDKFAAK